MVIATEETVDETVGDDAEQEAEQPQLPDMPPLAPPSLKNLAYLLNAVEKLYPSGDSGFSNQFQWERFKEIAETAFRGGIVFVIPLTEWQIEQDARAEAAKAMADAEQELAELGATVTADDGTVLAGD